MASNKNFVLDEFKINVSNRKILQGKLIDCLKIHFGLPWNRNLPSAFYKENRPPQWYKYIEWGSLNNTKKESLLDQSMTICEALQNTIIAFYEANGQKSKLVKTDVVAIDKEIGVNTDGYFDLEEMDISTGDKDSLRTKLLDCLKIHFKLDRKKDLSNNFYGKYNAPKWYKFLEWGPLNDVRTEHFKTKDLTYSNAFALTIAEFYKANLQEYKLINDTIDLPDPSTLFFFGAKDRELALIKIISKLKCRTKAAQNRRNIFNITIEWTDIDISKSTKVNALKIEQMYKVIIDGYNHFGYNLEPDYFADALNGRLRSIIAQTNPLELSCDKCKVKSDRVQYIYHNNRFYNCKLCENCKGKYSLSLLNENESDDDDLKQQVNSTMHILRNKSNEFLKSIKFNRFICSKLYIITCGSPNLINSKYSGFFSSWTRLPTHTLLIEIIRRFKLEFKAGSRFYKYYKFAQLINLDQKIYISVLMRPRKQTDQNHGFNFPVILLAETLTFRTNLRDPAFNIQGNSNILPIQFLLDNEESYYYVLKKVQFEFEDCKPIELNKLNLSKIDLSSIKQSMIDNQDPDELETFAFCHGEELVGQVINYKD